MEHVTFGDSGNVTGGDFTKHYGMRADILKAITNAESTTDRADAVTDGELAQRERARFERGTRDVFRTGPDDYFETVEDEELTSP